MNVVSDEEYIYNIFKHKYYELCDKYVIYCKEICPYANDEESKLLLNDIVEYEDFVKKYFNIEFH